MALLLLSGCASFDPVTKVLGDLGWTPTGQFNAVVASCQDERAVLQSVGYFSGPVGRAPQFRVALPWG